MREAKARKGAVAPYMDGWMDGWMVGWMDTIYDIKSLVFNEISFSSIKLFL